ncbi:MAG: biotin/lipoyl-binding protein, partial [Anaerolineae bacterium]|nr:biotin/lipoyl-binding protein [Anaerolineae bacterium]
MKRMLIAVVSVGVLLGVTSLLSGCGAAAGTPASGKTAAPTAPAVQADNRVVAEAKVAPVQSARLSLPAGGIVAELPVKEGQTVNAGQTLVKLDAARQAAAVAQAEAQLQRA